MNLRSGENGATGTGIPTEVFYGRRRPPVKRPCQPDAAAAATKRRSAPKRASAKPHRRNTAPRQLHRVSSAPRLGTPPAPAGRHGAIPTTAVTPLATPGTATGHVVAAQVITQAASSGIMTSKRLAPSTSSAPPRVRPVTMTSARHRAFSKQPVQQPDQQSPHRLPQAHIVSPELSPETKPTLTPHGTPSKWLRSNGKKMAKPSKAQRKAIRRRKAEGLD